MSGTNKLIKYAILEEGASGYDTFTDDQLLTLASTNNNEGIGFGAIARTNILNGIFRQLTHTNKVFGDLIKNNYGSPITIQTANTDSAYESYMKQAIGNIAKDVSVAKDTIGFTGTRSGITVNSQGLVTNVANLGINDLPSIAQNTFLGRTASGTGSVSALVGILYWVYQLWDLLKELVQYLCYR